MFLVIRQFSILSSPRNNLKQFQSSIIVLQSIKPKVRHLPKIILSHDCNYFSFITEERNKLCKKDILLVLDASRSVGPGLFKSYIKPFLQKLTSNARIKIGENGVQLALIPFSSDRNTKLYRKLQFPREGQPAQTQKKVDGIINRLRFSDLNRFMQDRTYTGKALQLAYDKVQLHELTKIARLETCNYCVPISIIINKHKIVTCREFSYGGNIYKFLQLPS